MKLALGAVQFGLNYGISNDQGKPAANEVSRMLAHAQKSGIHVIDTAPVYGDSEIVLGSHLPRPHKFRIVTKTPKDSRNIEQSVMQSCKNLQENALYALLVHDTQTILDTNGDHIFKELNHLKDNKIVKKIGVSLYDPEQLEAIWQRGYDIDIMQIPFNLADQRFLKNDLLARAKARGIEIHARSAFLQGLLLMEPDDLPSHMAYARPALKNIAHSLSETGLSRLQATLSFCLHQPHIDHVVCGAQSYAQLDELIKISHAPPHIQGDLARQMEIHQKTIYNPSLWPSKEQS